MSNHETLIGRILTFLRQAGAPSERATDRGGAFSYHAETHAAGVGAGVGLVAVLTGNYRFVGLLISVIFAGNRIPEFSDPKIIEDVKQEPHYALGGIVLGALIGVLAGGSLPL